MVQPGESDSINLEPMGEVAKDALRLFRMNILVIAVYSSIVGLMYQNDPDTVREIFNSYYTIIGLFFWVGTSTTAIFSYRASRKLSTAKVRSNTDEILEKLNPGHILNLVIFVSIWLLITVFGFLFGFLDGLSSDNIPLWFTGIVVGIGLTMIAFIVITVEGISYSTDVISTGISKTQSKINDFIE
jgi:hypothetical protein